MNSNNGIYYFLGNITSHILHALPLHKELGGTFIVTSRKARKKIEKLYNVPVINIDSKPYKWMKPGRRPKPIHEYITLDASLKKTYDFLNTNAKVILFYELFDIEKPEWLEKPKKVFLTHGNMLKSYMTMHPKRLKIVKDYDYIAGLGPYMTQRFIEDGVPPSKIAPIGIARTDDIVKPLDEESRRAICSKLNINPSDKIAIYAPTFWGASSVHSLGLDMIPKLSGRYTLIFRPHPQTPKSLIKKYLLLTRDDDRVIFAPENNTHGVSLQDVLKIANVIIGDVSSVMLEALLLKKPLVFALDSKNLQSDRDYDSIEGVVKYSQFISSKNVSNSAYIIDVAIKNGVDEDVWERAVGNNFFNANGTSVSTIKRFIKSL